MNSRPQQQEQHVAVVLKENIVQRPVDNDSDQDVEEKVPDIQRDDLAKRKTQGPVSQQKEPLVFGTALITKADLATWQRLKLSSDNSENMTSTQAPSNIQSSNIDMTRASSDDFGRRKLSLQKKRARNKQKFVHFGPVTEIDQQRWDRLCIAKPGVGELNVSNGAGTDLECAKAVFSDNVPNIQIMDSVPVCHLQAQQRSSYEVCTVPDVSPVRDSEDSCPPLDVQRDDMLARRMGTFNKSSRITQPSPAIDNQQNVAGGGLINQEAKIKDHKQPLQEVDQLL